MPTAKPFDSRAYIKYSCVPHSSVNSYVTIAIRSLHASSPWELFHTSVDSLYSNTTSSSCCTPSDPMQTPSVLYGDVSYGNRYRISVRLLGQGGHTLDGVRMPLSTTFSSIWRPVDSSNIEPLYPTLGCSHSCTWDDNILVFPVKWKDLPRNAMFYLEVFMAGSSSQTGKAVAVATFSIWEQEKGTLKMGFQRIHVSPCSAGHKPQEVPCENNDASWDAFLDLEKLNEMAQYDADMKKNLVTTSEKIPSVSPNQRGSAAKSSPTQRQQSMDLTTAVNTTASSSNLENGLQENESTRIPPVPWLDEITRQRCEQILKEERSAFDGKSQDLYADDGSDFKRQNCSHLFIPSRATDEDKQYAILVVELPQCTIPVVYEEIFYNTTIQGASGSVSAYDLSLYHKHQGPSSHSHVESLLDGGKFSIPMPNPLLYREDTSDKMGLNLVQLLDFECEEDNPVEEKYRTLQHELIRGLVDPALKPDKEQRARINAIIGSTSQHLTREEKDLLWRFRFSLVDNRKALTKFLLAVEWDVESEVVQAAELLSQWRMRSPIEVTDALRLLGKNVAFRTSLVRTYAIETLAASPDDELVLYLLQLVQALKYEHIDVSSSTQVSADTNVPKSSLDSFLIERAAKNIQLANFLYWYLRVEMEDPSYGARYRNVFNAFQEKLSSIPFNSRVQRRRNFVDSKNPFLSLWGLEDKSNILVESSRSMWDALQSQDRFITGIMECQKISREAKGKRDNKEQHLRELLKSEGLDTISSGGSVPLPSAPSVMVKGVKPESVRMFKSALYPALIEFITDSSDKDSEEKAAPDAQNQAIGTCKVIVKTGDDLRQDQLVIMMILVMDVTLKRGTLDLCLKPYSIIATSTTSGLVEFVENSFPISQILSAYNNSIMQFFQKVAPSNGAKFGVNPDVLQRYIRSCAGYCVITYLLGVGDRHLDNIMLQASGHFFHIDFGFIFGRDPKPLPPAFRLTREMVDGMGGMESPEYRQFCSLACQAFNLLRKSAGLILNLLYLMCDAGIEDLSNNPYSDSEGVITKVEERFRLELTDEQAETFFLALINDCLSALAPRVMDVFHQIAVSRR